MILDNNDMLSAEPCCASHKMTLSVVAHILGAAGPILEQLLSLWPLQLAIFGTDFIESETSNDKSSVEKGQSFLSVLYK